jgi:CubicO group peptidase (beta-lactamase class C family)
MIESAAVLPPRDAFPGDALAERYRTGFVALELADGVVRSCAAHTGPVLDGVGALRDDSILWIGCLSKPLTATAVLLLCDRGELALDDSLGRFLPELSAPLRTLTIAELLAHRGGLPTYPPGWHGFFDRAWLSETLATTARRAPDPDETVRGRRVYSGMGYVLLAAAIERVSSLPFSTFVTRELFEPLGMADTFGIDAIPPARADRLAPVFGRGDTGVSVIFDPRAGEQIANAIPFGGFFSTARDIARVVQMFFDRGFAGRRQLLRPETVSHMLREDVHGNGIHQALGWFVAFAADGDRRSQPCGFWHSSSNGSLIVANAIDRSAIVILGQRLLTADLIPVRVTQWKFAEAATRLRPYASEAPPSDDARDWLRQLHAPNREADATAPETPDVVRR